MERTTQTASKLVVTLYDLDGKLAAVYDTFAPTPAFCDLANTLDHLRNSGLEPRAEEVRPPKVIGGRRAS